VIEVWTDGACSQNPGPGGWAFVIQSAEGTTEGSGGHVSTTNNRMELMAAIQGLAELPDESGPIEVVSDSVYVVEGARVWMHKWKARGWRRAGGPLINVDLWKLLHAQVERLSPTFRWVKGHAGHALNERCDGLAVAAALRATRKFST
jgi:ribonuclease HI